MEINKMFPILLKINKLFPSLLEINQIVLEIARKKWIVSPQKQLVCKPNSLINFGGLNSPFCNGAMYETCILSSIVHMLGNISFISNLQ